MYQEEKPIKQVINDLLDTYKLTGKIDELKLWNNWEEIVGVLIAKNTGKILLKGHTLIIQVSSAPMKNELYYHRSVILQKVNTFFKKEIVKDIYIK
ncbi:MAG: DUF721 domain-containing protein [Flavobacteriales bacterium]|nr:DUF721 domain-containing protein [Flavobacteriales bacterium]